MTRRLLITGAGGFIGSALLGALATDNEIWVVSASGRVSIPPSGHLIQIDLSRPEASARLRAELPNEPFDAVLHLAALTPRSGERDMERFFAVNAFGTRYLLEGLPAVPSRFAYFSTVDVYGCQGEDEVLRENFPVAPHNTYAISKYTGECIARAWQGGGGCPVDVFRLGQVYGPGDPTGKVIPAFCAAVVAGRSPVVQGTGEEVRQPLHLRDVIAAVLNWLEKDPPTVGRTFLLAGRERITICDLARLVMIESGLEGEPRFRPHIRAGKPVHFRCNTRRTETELGWMPCMPLRSGIAEILKDLRSGTEQN